MQGKIIIFTSPSGAGKTTIVRHLLQAYPDKLAFSISATTRSVRKGEKDGLHYYFMSVDEFKQKLDNQEFLESEEVYEGLYYGTLISEIDRLDKEGKTAILDIDVNGASNIKQQYGDKVLSVFVSPPSRDVLIERLKGRGTESPEEFEKRVRRMDYELQQKELFDAIIVNDRLEDSFKQADELIEGFLN